jgi:drug/metabolite transporter (DMT)-like permease
VFSALFSALALPFLVIADPTVLDVGWTHLAVLAGVGVLNLCVLFFYLKAIQSDEVSCAIVHYQLVPVLAYGLGYLVLGEALTPRQLFAMFVIVAGTSLLSVNLADKAAMWLRGRTMAYMLAASCCWAMGAVLFKAVALEEQVIRSLFWEHVILTLAGLGLVAFVPAYRRRFLKAFRSNSGAVLALNFANEAIYILANVVMGFAYLLAPVSIVLLANSYQSVFALTLGICLTRWGRGAVREDIQFRQLGRKALAIAVTGFGTYLLLAPSR